MQPITITSGTHSQSGKTCKFINILGQSFTYSDKRGHSMHTTIDLAFAKEIIESIPAKHYYADRMPSSEREMKLSWSWFGGLTYELRIHYGSDHVYTSEKLIAA